MLKNIFSRFWNNAPLSIKAIVVVILPMTIMLGSLTYLYSQEQNSANLEQKLFIALKNQRDIQSISILLNEASVATRNYLLTQDESFISQFKQYEKQVRDVTEQLHQHLESADQKQLLKEIGHNIEENLLALNNMMQMRPSQKLEELSKVFHTQVDLYEKISQQLNAMALKQSSLIEQDYANINQERQQNLELTLVAAISSLFAVILGAWLFSVTIVKRIHFLRDRASHLAKGEVIEIGSQSHDELGDLTNELNIASHLLSDSIRSTNQAKQVAEQANRAKSMFLSRTSHELRTPLNTIIGFAEILEDDLKNSNSVEHLHMIQKASRHLLKLIDELLDIAKIERGEIDLKLESVDIGQVIEEAVTFIRPLAQTRDIQIQISHSPAIYALADRQRLLQVILNLLNNAIKYGPPNALVSVEASAQNTQVQIAIQDQGDGIPAHLQERLFTPFDRIGAEKTKIEGTGLGLVVSKQLMVAMQGELKVSSQNSSFTLILPISKIAPQSHEEVMTASSQQHNHHVSGKKMRVLYVEDNKSNMALMEALLRRYPTVEMLRAYTLTEARRMLNDVQLQLLLLDLNLPDGNCLDLLKELRAAGQDYPIWILSADASEQVKDNGLKLGANLFLSKPLDVAEFHRCMNALIDKFIMAKNDLQKHTQINKTRKNA